VMSCGRWDAQVRRGFEETRSNPDDESTFTTRNESGVDVTPPGTFVHSTV
jgi:hypothetical protein